MTAASTVAVAATVALFAVVIPLVVVLAALITGGDADDCFDTFTDDDNQGNP